jgi:Ca-activated chloride channel family protein
VNFGVGSLWAKAKIEHALDRLRRGAPEDLVRAEVVDTALTYRLVSRYTSLVAVDRTPTRRAGVASTEEPVANLKPRGLDVFPATATPQAMLRLIGITMVLLAFVIAVVAGSVRRNALA